MPSRVPKTSEKAKPTPPRCIVVVIARQNVSVCARSARSLNTAAGDGSRYSCFQAAQTVICQIAMARKIASSFGQSDDQIFQARPDRPMSLVEIFVGRRGLRLVVGAAVSADMAPHLVLQLGRQQ